MRVSFNKGGTEKFLFFLFIFVAKVSDDKFSKKYGTSSS